ncbi:MAG: SURF1 family protein [Sphingobium sp.]
MNRPRAFARGAAVAVLLLLLAAAFIDLGIWQIERRAWKHELIASVEARVHRPPVDAPGPAEWPRITPEHDAYTHVRLAGRYLPESDTRVRAVTDLGAGYWVMSPLDTGRFIVLINRGFVPQGVKPAPVPEGQVAVTGLLRTTEPHGGFLRANDPERENWYSRDVAAIASARNLRHAAPYFIDAAATSGNGGYPVGGLTVVRFSDNHLVYALTWFALAALSLVGVWRLAARSAHSDTGFMPL